MLETSRIELFMPKILPCIKIVRRKQIAPQTGKKCVKLFEADLIYECSRRNVLRAKEKWYLYRTDKYDADWDKYIKYAIQRIEKYGMDTADVWEDNNINGVAWDGIFLHSNNRRQLKVAIGWMKEVVRRNPGQANYIDTYANLLYKRGRTQEAIILQEEAARLKPNDNEIVNSLQKMRQGEATWPVSKSRR